jgi:D-alanine-D-alanine ligase
MTKRRVLVLFDTDGEPPADQDYSRQVAEGTEEVEFEVAKALRDRGHDVRLLGFKKEIQPLLAGLTSEPFDVVFNLVERFRDLSALDFTVAGMLEMLGAPYTGAAPAGLILARDKALTKMILSHEGVKTPRFVVVPRSERCPRSIGLPFPIIVKPIDEDASVGIAHASVVRDEEALVERVTFVHDRLRTGAIAEEFIAGRELYVGVLGNEKPKALPPIEMVWKADTHESQRIATFKTKWSMKYRESRGIENQLAEDLSDEVRARLADTAVRAFRATSLRDYGRIDVRLTKEGEIYVVEANPNPYLSDGEDYAWAAEEAGHPYPELLEHIMDLALARQQGPRGG